MCNATRESKKIIRRARVAFCKSARSHITIWRRGLYMRKEKLCFVLIKVCQYAAAQSLFIYATFTSAIYHGTRQIKRKCACFPKRFGKCRSVLKYVTQTEITACKPVGPHATRASDSIYTKWLWREFEIIRWYSEARSKDHGKHAPGSDLQINVLPPLKFQFKVARSIKSHSGIVRVFFREHFPLIWVLPLNLTEKRWNNLRGI